MSPSGFRVIQAAAQLDQQGRLALGQDIKAKTYRISQNDQGQILLDPIVAIPEQERWLFENPEALDAVHQGLAESAAGAGQYVGSFAKYADLELEDE